MKSQSNRWAKQNDNDSESKMPPLSGSDIVVVEDDRGMRNFLSMILEEDDHRVTSVASGTDFVGAATKTGYPESTVGSLDLVVLDWCLPGMSGAQFLKWVRQLGVSVPILVISSFFNEDALREATELGATMVLSKPFDVDDFQSAVKGLTA